MGLVPDVAKELREFKKLLTQIRDLLQELRDKEMGDGE